MLLLNMFKKVSTSKSEMLMYAMAPMNDGILYQKRKKFFHY